MVDIKNFYKSIKQKLPWEAIRFSRRYSSITNKEIEAIFHAKKSLLYYKDESWVKKVECNFDVTMGANDRAEVSELICILTLLLLSKHTNKNHIGLYRDDGLAI